MSATISRYRTTVADDKQPTRDRLKKLLSEHSHKVERIGDIQWNGMLWNQQAFQQPIWGKER